MRLLHSCVAHGIYKGRSSTEKMLIEKKNEGSAHDSLIDDCQLFGRIAAQSLYLTLKLSRLWPSS